MSCLVCSKSLWQLLKSPRTCLLKKKNKETKQVHVQFIHGKRLLKLLFIVMCICVSYSGGYTGQDVCAEFGDNFVQLVLSIHPNVGSVDQTLVGWLR